MEEHYQEPSHIRRPPGSRTFTRMVLPAVAALSPSRPASWRRRTGASLASRPGGSGQSLRWWSPTAAGKPASCAMPTTPGPRGRADDGRQRLKEGLRSGRLPCDVERQEFVGS